MILIIYRWWSEFRWTDPPQLPVERQKRNPSRGSSGNDSQQTANKTLRFESFRNGMEQRWPVSLGIRHAAYLVAFFFFFSFSFLKARTSWFDRTPVERRLGSISFYSAITATDWLRHRESLDDSLFPTRMLGWRFVPNRRERNPMFFSSTEVTFFHKKDRNGRNTQENLRRKASNNIKSLLLSCT